MHYYQFNIADYRKDTTHLSVAEHYIYRTLIDWYYLDEKEIPKKTQLVSRRLGLGSSGLAELKNVLEDFFILTKTGWRHDKIEVEIAKYHQKANQNKINGAKGGRPKNEQKQSDSKTAKPKRTQPVNSANPDKPNCNPAVSLTNNYKPITNNQLKDMSEKKPLAQKSKNKFSDDDLKTAKYIAKLVDNLGIGAPPPSLHTWANTVRLMIERDKRTHLEICELFRFSCKHDFWGTVVHGPAKLRKQWPKLKAAEKRVAGALNSVPRQDSDLEAFAHKAGLSAPRVGESYQFYRSRLTSELQQGP